MADSLLRLYPGQPTLIPLEGAFLGYNLRRYAEPGRAFLVAGGQLQRPYLTLNLSLSTLDVDAAAPKATGQMFQVVEFSSDCGV